MMILYTLIVWQLIGFGVAYKLYRDYQQSGQTPKDWVTAIPLTTSFIYMLALGPITTLGVVIVISRGLLAWCWEAGLTKLYVSYYNWRNR